jgi:putative tryptophan/tyrosine transport system substrate-binding protein
MGEAMRRREFTAFVGGTAAAWPLAAHAQQCSSMRRVGVILAYAEGDPEVQRWLATFRDGLGKLGWVEGQNLHFEFRWTGSDSSLMEKAAKELVAAQPDLIITSSSPVTGMLLAQTRTIPIVFTNIVDPVGQGFVTSLSRPGGNATGLVNLEPSMAGKWVELLKEVMPPLARAIVPIQQATAPYANLYLNYFKSTALPLGVEVIAAPADDMSAFEHIAAAQEREVNTGIIPMPSAFMLGHVVEIAAITTRYRLPTIFFNHAFPAAGGLLSYGNDITDNYRRATVFVDRILKGDKPSELPVQFPVKFELVINLKTAKALGITIPQTMLVAADEVIE